MIANVDKVIEWLEVNETPFFTVQTSAGENTKIFETREDESFEDAKARLRRVMSMSFGNRFIIKAKKELKAGRGIFQEEFRNLSDEASKSADTPTIAGMPGGYVAIGELERRLSDERRSIMQDVRIERLEAENKELRDEVNAKDDIAHRFMEKLNPYIGTIAGSIASKFIPQPAPTIGVAGIETTDSHLEASEEDEERLEAAINRFVKAEKDYIRVIETLAELAEKQDATYLMAKQMLIK